LYPALRIEENMAMKSRKPILPVGLALAICLVVGTPSHADEKGDLLLAATRKGDVTSVKRLLDEGANVNARTRYNSTPLFFACDRGNLEIATLLISRGADLNVKDNFYNATALTWAMSKKHDAIVGLLIEKGVDVTDALAGAAREGDRKLLDLILEKGKVTQAALDDALLVATVMKNDKNQGMAAVLEAKGAKAPSFVVDETALKSYEGKFSEADTNFTFAVKEGKLNFVTPQASTVLIPLSKDRFRFVQAGFDFNFERDAQGNVAGVRFASRGGDTKLKKVN
jgi:ankyrin repeat protein